MRSLDCCGKSELHNKGKELGVCLFLSFLFSLIPDGVCHFSMVSVLPPFPSSHGDAWGQIPQTNEGRPGQEEGRGVGSSIKTSLRLLDLSAGWRDLLHPAGGFSFLWGWEGSLRKEGSCSHPPSSVVDRSKHRCEPELFIERLSQQAQSDARGHVCRCVSQAFFG